MEEATAMGHGSHPVSHQVFPVCSSDARTCRMRSGVYLYLMLVGVRPPFFNSSEPGKRCAARYLNLKP